MAARTGFSCFSVRSSLNSGPGGDGDNNCLQQLPTPAWTYQQLAWVSQPPVSITVVTDAQLCVCFPRCGIGGRRGTNPKRTLGDMTVKSDGVDMSNGQIATGKNGCGGEADLTVFLRFVQGSRVHLPSDHVDKMVARAHHCCPATSSSTRTRSNLSDTNASTHPHLAGGGVRQATTQSGSPLKPMEKICGRPQASNLPRAAHCIRLIGHRAGRLCDRKAR